MYIFIINGAEIPACLNTSIATLSKAVAVGSAAKTGPGVWRSGRFDVHHFPPGNKENATLVLPQLSLFASWGAGES